MSACNSIYTLPEPVTEPTIIAPQSTDGWKNATAAGFVPNFLQTQLANISIAEDTALHTLEV